MYHAEKCPAYTWAVWDTSLGAGSGAAVTTSASSEIEAREMTVITRQRDGLKRRRVVWKMRRLEIVGAYDRPS